MKIEIIAVISPEDADELAAQISETLDRAGIFFTISVNQSKVFGGKK